MAHHRLAPSLLVALLTSASGAAAEDSPLSAPPAAAPAKPAPPPTPEEGADSVLAAVRAKDEVALKALAASDAPDPWLVADELIRRGEHVAAEAFARAAPRIDTEALPTYVEAQRGVTDDPARRARLAAAGAALAAQTPAKTLDALGPLESLPVRDVVGVRLEMSRGLALATLVRLEESSAAFSMAAEGAQRLGWLARASSAYHEAGVAAYRGAAFSAAQAAWERLLTVCERRADQAKAAKALGNLGIVSARMGDYAKALSLLERALAMKEALGDRVEAASTLSSIGGIHYLRSDYAMALLTYERALAAQLSLDEKAGAAKTLGNLGNVHYSLGDYAKALSTYERALAAQEALGQKVDAALVLGSIGLVHLARGNYAEALATFERALEVQEALGDKAQAATTLGNIGNVYYSLGDYAKALSIHERSLAVKEAIGDKAGAGRSLSSVANAHWSLGNFAKALSTHERAFSLLEALGDRAGAATTLGNIGILHHAMGGYAKALAMFERGLAAQEALGDRVGAALTLGNIGIVYTSLSDYTNALSALDRSLAAKVALGDKAGAALTLGNIGIAHWFKGDYPQALAAHMDALAAKQALGDKVGAARTLSAIGVVHAAMGDNATALSTYEQALETLEALGDKVYAAKTLGNMGGVHVRMGAYTKALAYERRAVRTLASIVRWLGAEEGASAREPLAFIYDIGAKAAVAANDTSELAFFLESGRAGALLEGLKSREALWSTAVSAELRAAELKARAVESAATKALRAVTDAEDLAVIRARRVELDAAREQVSAAVARIQREAKAGAALVYPEAATLVEILATLVAGDVLVLYGMLEKDACALVVTTAEARIVALGENAKIEEAVRALALDDQHADPTTALAALKALVVAPLGLPATARRLLVSPAGVLGYVPFATLVSEATVSYIPSGTTYRLLLEEQGLRGQGVLALGDPDYQTKVDEQALAIHRGGTKRLLPLPGTRGEAKAVGTVTLLGLEATEAGLRSALEKRPRWRAVHLACHGFVDVERPELSSLALTASGDEDGFLSALDVFRLRIPSDLVVLSACETGKGKVVKSEGIVGLTRAFMFAGSPRILCSLWKVPDEATSALMTKFYELWNPKDGRPGLPAAEALREAQVHVRAQEQWKHPYHWAAWVLWGLPD